MEVFPTSQKFAHSSRIFSLVYLRHTETLLILLVESSY